MEKSPFQHILWKDSNKYEVFVTNDSGSIVAKHWHNAVEFIYVFEGSLEVQIGDDQHIIHPEEYIVIPSKTVHGTKCTQGNRGVLIQLSLEFLNNYIFNFEEVQLIAYPDMDQVKYKDYMKALMKQIKSRYHAELASDRLRFDRDVYELVAFIYDHHKRKKNNEGAALEDKNIEKLEPIIHYTNTHYNQPITIDKVASIAGFQPKYFCRYFKRHMGTTYMNYLNETRLSRIYRDLFVTDKPIAILLEEHGFTNEKLFRRLFKERFGDTPSTIRKKNI